MKERLIRLLLIAQRHGATDVHFLLEDERLQVSLRALKGIRVIDDPLFDRAFFQYLKYLANLDLGSKRPQSSAFTLSLNGSMQYFRFSLIVNRSLETAVLRILSNHPQLKVQDLTKQKQCVAAMVRWCRFRSGMILLRGPTGSGKTTTLHALLHLIAKRKQLKIITLEDPIEIISQEYLQLQVNEAADFSYEEGIKQLLRHDPDVIMIGEIRDAHTAKMAYRCALSGHMVFTCIHAKSATEALKRMEELGVSRSELKQTLTAVSSQRLMTAKNGKERICIYEILEKDALTHYLEGWNIEHEHDGIHLEIRKALENGWISKKSAEQDLEVY